MQKIDLQNPIEAALGAGPIGEISKNSVERAKIICAGKVRTVQQVESDTVSVTGLAIDGNWQEADFFIDHLIKGDVTSAHVMVRFFVPCDSMQGIYFEAVPEGRRCLLFLVPRVDHENTYVLLNRTGSVVVLAPEPPVGIGHAAQTERLKSELLGAAAAEETWIAVPALRSLLRIGLTDIEVIEILKEASMKDDRAVAGTALALRICLMDKTSLNFAKTFVESGKCPESQCKEIEAALRLLTAPHFFTDLQDMFRSPSVFLRRGASYALRCIDNDAVVPIFISALRDEDQEVRYNAVAGLASFTSKTGQWFPAYPVFIKNQTYYISRWEKWWETEGKDMHGKIDGKKG
jgi:hypothetical protein